jgi:hypothetical protein
MVNQKRHKETHAYVKYSIEREDTQAYNAKIREETKRGVDQALVVCPKKFTSGNLLPTMQTKYTHMS